MSKLDTFDPIFQLNHSAMLAMTKMMAMTMMSMSKIMAMTKMMPITKMVIEHLCLAGVKLSILYCKRLPRLAKKHRYRPIINNSIISNMSVSHRDPNLNLIEFRYQDS